MNNNNKCNKSHERVLLKYYESTSEFSHNQIVFFCDGSNWITYTHTQIQLPTHLTLGTCTPIYSSDWIRRIFFFTKMMKTVCVWVNSVDIWMGCYILILRIHSLRSLRVCLCWCFVLSCSHPTRITIAHNIFTYFSFLLLVMAKWNR